MRRVIIEKQTATGWAREDSKPFDEATCAFLSERNGMCTPVAVAIGLGTGGAIYIGLPHNQRRAMLEAAA